MTRKNQQPVTPKLRFPEFRDALQWVQKPLGDLTEPVTERVGDSECIPFTVTTGEGLVSQEDKYGRTIAGKSLKNYYRLQTDDFAFNKSATKLYPQGYIARFQGNERAAVPNSIFTCFRIADEDVVDAAYLDYLFQGNLHGRWLKDYITVGARAHGALNISDDDLFALPVPLPAGDEMLAEQQRIADCLGSLDELITAEGRKLEALRDHKKGLMQQLFPREGETQPRLRFPEFQDTGEWQDTALGPLTRKVGSGITPKGGSKNYKESGRPFIRSQNVGWGHLILDDVAHIDEETHASFDGTEIEPDDVLINISGASIGRCAVADERIVGGNVNQHVCIIRTDRETLQPFFLSQYLLSESGQAQIDQCQAGGNRQGLNFGQIRSFTMPLAPLESEQHRIAACLTALDDQIAAQARKLAALKRHKKGLMQQLFPSQEPTTGGGV